MFALMNITREYYNFSSWDSFPFFIHSGTLSTVEHTVFQEWFEYLMSHEKPQIDLIGL